jgi:hypothetical protein
LAFQLLGPSASAPFVHSRFASSLRIRQFNGRGNVIVQPRNTRAFEYLLQAIATARSVDELKRLQTLARAHYTGPLLDYLESGIVGRRKTLPTTTAHGADQR